MNTPDALELLRHTCEQFSPFTELAWADFAVIWHPFEAKRKTLLTTAGSTERYLYFVLEGVQRAYAVHANGSEATLVFMYPPSFAGVADSFLLQKPARYFFETLTPSAFLRTTHAQLALLMERHACIQQLVMQATAITLEGTLSRQIELQTCSSEEKFRALLQRSPHVLTMIPHKYLASYIGVDATNFSKLLNSVRLG
jgi:CRP-like cAMP-binding protein